MLREYDVVSEEFLKEVFSSKNFIEINKEAARQTKRKERETAYVITKEFGNDDPHDIHFSQVVLGEERSISSYLEVKKIAEFIKGGSEYPLVSAHFHVPGADLTPSLNDLRIVNRCSWSLYSKRVKPINIIGENIPVEDSNDVQDLFLYQQQKPWSIALWLRSRSLFRKFETTVDKRFDELKREIYTEVDDCIKEDEKYTAYKIATNLVIIEEIDNFYPEIYKAHVLYIQNDEIFPLELAQDFSFTANK